MPSDGGGIVAIGGVDTSVQSDLLIEGGGKRERVVIGWVDRVGGNMVG